MEKKTRPGNAKKPTPRLASDRNLRLRPLVRSLESKHGLKFHCERNQGILKPFMRTVADHGSTGCEARAQTPGPCIHDRVLEYDHRRNIGTAMTNSDKIMNLRDSLPEVQG
jgi:hypothetical protein